MSITIYCAIKNETVVEVCTLLDSLCTMSALLTTIFVSLKGQPQSDLLPVTSTDKFDNYVRWTYYNVAKTYRFINTIKLSSTEMYSIYRSYMNMYTINYSNRTSFGFIDAHLSDYHTRVVLQNYRVMTLK